MKNRLRHLLLPLVLCASATPAAFAVPEIQSAEFAEFDVTLLHTGDPGGRYALEISNDLSAWTAIDRSVEFAPGEFFVATAPAPRDERLFLRINGDLSPPLLDWMDAYPNSPIDGADIPENDPFKWASLGAPGLTYHFELFNAYSDGLGGYFPSPEPLLSVPGLTAPAHYPPFGTAGLHTGGEYLWRVTVRLGNRAIQGRNVQVFGPGKTTGNFNFPLAALRLAPRNPGGPAAAVDWAKLLRAINELADRKDKLTQELAKNPLLADSALYSELFTLFKLDAPTQAALTAILKGDFSSLTDPEIVLKVLKYAEALAKFASRPKPGESQSAQQKALAAFANRLGQIRATLENAADRAAQLQSTLNSLNEAVEEVRSAVEKPLDYLLHMIQKGLLDEIKAKLVKLVGQRAAGSLIGLASDLAALAQAIGAITELEDLCREQNRLILKAIECAPAEQVVSGSGDLDLPPRPAGYPPGCSVTVTAEKYCWSPTAGGGPNDGHFVPSPVRFAGPVPALTFSIDTGAVAFKTPKLIFHPADINCQPNQGPCLLFIKAVTSCPGQGPGRTLTYFAGVIRCP